MANMEQDTWLAQVEEDIIDPDLPIVDPHHHLWHHTETPYLLEDLRVDTGSGHNVTHTVFVECGSEYFKDGPEHMRPVGETHFVADIARASRESDGATIGAIVGHANLLLGEGITDVLDAHVEAGGGLFRGIRHSSAWDASDAIRPSHSNPPPDLYERPETRAALKVLGSKGLSFDAWHYHPFMRRFEDLARAVPDTLFVLDHFGGPIGIGPYEGKKDEIFKTWSADLASLARCENVVLKIGGLAMPVNGWEWHKRATPVTSDELVAAHGRYYAHAIESFGPQRVMFESNFPVDRRSVSYPVLWNAFKKISQNYSQTETNQMFFHTAARVYALT